METEIDVGREREELLTPTPAGGGRERRVAVQVNASCEGGDGATDKKGGVVKTDKGVSWLRVMQSQVWDKVRVCFVIVRDRCGVRAVCEHCARGRAKSGSHCMKGDIVFA